MTRASHFSTIPPLRHDFHAIARWVNPASSVLDLGCGSGELLAYLQAERRIYGYGIEIRDENVLACVQKGVDVIQKNLEDGLALFEDQSFDSVILSQTLQTIHRTEYLLREIVRVGKEGIVSFPNFGYWTHRLSVLRGRMPVSKSLPYQWYNTPNVRVLTIDDFEILAQEVGLRILDRIILTQGRPINWLPNLLGNLAVYRVCRVASSHTLC